MSTQHIFVLEDTLLGSAVKKSVVLPPAPTELQQDVFAESMLETSSTRQKRQPLKWAVSLVVHISALGFLLILPLYFSQKLDLNRFSSTLLVAPLPPAAAPPPPPVAIARVAHITPRPFTPGKLTSPSYVPKAVIIATDDAAPADAFAGVPGGVPGGIGQLTGVLGGSINGPAAPAIPVAVSEAPKRPVRIGGALKAPKLLSGPAPAYPILAQQSHVQGVVVIDAVIDEHGNVIQEHAISGNPLLIPAALEAVSKRKYEPTVLDGQPTSVALKVEVSFLPS